MREFVDLPASATVEEIASRIASVGFEVAGIDGDVIDFEVTANRPDCLSVRGLAREAATAFGLAADQMLFGGRTFRSGGHAGSKDPASGDTPASEDTRASHATLVPVSIESPLCGRYAL